MSFYKAILRTPLFKVTSLNGISVLLKIGVGLITSKVLAVFVGPGGMALVGNLRNLLTSVESLSTLGFQNGIIKYVADHKGDDDGLKKIISTVFICLLITAFALSGILFCFSRYWNAMIFGTGQQYDVVFKILALALPWYAVTIALIAVINGLGKFRKVIYVNIIGNILGLVFSVFMVLHFKTLGALLSLIIPPSLLFFAAYFFINRQIRFSKALSIGHFDFQIVKCLSGYSLMAVVSSVCGPMVFLAIRNNLIENIGIEQAGYWEAMTRISTYYLLFISTILTVYFLPKLAFANTKNATRNVFRSYYIGIMPAFAIGLAALYLMRFFVVKILFTEAFLPVADLFFWQLLGDVFKASALILGYQFFAKQLTVAFIITEIGSLATMYLTSSWFIKIYQAEGVVMAHALTYFIYLLALIGYFRKSLFKFSTA